MLNTSRKEKYRATAERVNAILADPNTSVEFKNSLVDQVIEFCINQHSIVEPETLRLVYPYFCEMEGDDPLAAIVASWPEQGGNQASPSAAGDGPEQGTGTFVTGDE